MKFVVAQVLGLIAFGFGIVATQQETKHKILLINSFGSLITLIQYLILGAYTGCISCIIVVVRNYVFESFKGKIPLYVLILYFIFSIAITIPAYDGIISLIPLWCVLVYGYGIWQNNVKTLKLITIIVDWVGIIYDAFNLAIINCIRSIISSISAIIGYIKTCKLENEKKASEF